MWKTILLIFLDLCTGISFSQIDLYRGQWIEAEAEVPSVCRLHQDFRESELGFPWESVQLS